jgi:hypothetical protein
MEFDDHDADDGADLQQLRTDVLEGMREYLAGVLDSGGEPGYTGADIGECGRILDACLAGIEIAAHGDEEAVTAAVRDATLALNVLNARCNHHLIENDQREHLCALFGQAAIARGVGSGSDLTAEWREW